MTPELAAALEKLTESQRIAVDWNSDALLVLAGPGSGKTQVLTCRIARLLSEQPDKSFRVLALTFTNKAADEMKARVAQFVPGLEERANIGTFHSFCAQVLRQHGVHIGVNPDFAIYSADEDRKALLEDALREGANSGLEVDSTDTRFLPIIDRLKQALVDVENANAALSKYADGARIATVYQLYEQQLRKLNALDFSSLIHLVYQLIVRFPTIAARYRKTHPYWLLDEFQDTNRAQYKLIAALAGDSFRNVFAVADDDQIIYGWNGASFQRIQEFQTEFGAIVMQLPTNYRCPPAIVEAANKLVMHNSIRSASKSPLIAGKTKYKYPVEQHIEFRTFESDEAEAAGIAEEIANLGPATWGGVAVLARTRALLERTQRALKDKSVPAVIAQRRDEFMSPEFKWLVAALKQVVRPLDKRNLSTMVEGFNALVGSTIIPNEIIAEAEASGRSYFATWAESVRLRVEPEIAVVLSHLEAVSVDQIASKQSIDAIIEALPGVDSENGESDKAEDLLCWRDLSADIYLQIGRKPPLDQFLQELQLRSKEPPPKPGVVTLMTVHGSKGKEFEVVYLIGLAEDVLPSYQSRSKGDGSPEMEEERRNCFVAITRTRERLILSHAERYRGWVKPPSRFLVEMGLVPAAA